MLTAQEEISTLLQRAPRYASSQLWKAIPPYESEYTAKDIIYALKALVGESAIKGPICDLFSRKDILLLSNGRQCLFAILKALGLRSKARVGVPLYCCPAVFEAIVAAGHVPVFLDVDLATYSISPRSLQRSGHNLDALVVVHLFGYPTNLKVMRECLAGYRIPIVEDCAHALFTRCHEFSVGTQSEGAFFSFGPHKPAATGGGGIAIFNPHTGKALHAVVPDSRQSLVSELLHIARCCARALLYKRPIYGAVNRLLSGRKRDRVKSHAQEEQTGEMPSEYCVSQMRRCDKALIAQRVLEFQARLKNLSRNAHHLRMALRGTLVALPEEPDFGQWNHFFLPVRYRDATSRARGRAYLAKNQIHAVSLYSNCMQYAKRFGYSGGCPNAEEAAETVVIIPNHSWLSPGEIELIGNAVRNSAES